MTMIFQRETGFRSSNYLIISYLPMVALIIFAVIMLLLAAYDAKQKDWWSSAGFVLLSVFFVWIYFQLRL